MIYVFWPDFNGKYWQKNTETELIFHINKTVNLEGEKSNCMSLSFRLTQQQIDWFYDSESSNNPMKLAKYHVFYRNGKFIACCFSKPKIESILLLNFEAYLLPIESKEFEVETKAFNWHEISFDRSFDIISS